MCLGDRDGRVPRQRLEPGYREGRAVQAPPTVDVVHVVQQPLNVTLSLPGQLAPYQTVAVYREGDGLREEPSQSIAGRASVGRATGQLEAPELVAQRAEAQSKLQSAEAQLAVTAPKADASASTYDRFKAASAADARRMARQRCCTRAKDGGRGPESDSAARQTVEAARQALESVRDMEGYLRITAPIQRRCDRTQRASGSTRRSVGRARYGVADRTDRREQSTSSCDSSTRVHRRRDERHVSNIHGLRVPWTDVYRRRVADFAGQSTPRAPWPSNWT